MIKNLLKLLIICNLLLFGALTSLAVTYDSNGTAIVDDTATTTATTTDTYTDNEVNDESNEIVSNDNDEDEDQNVNVNDDDDSTSEFDAYLYGGEEVPPVTTDATGTISLRISENEEEIEYVLHVGSLEDGTAAHLHCGLKGENGPIVVGLFEGSPTTITNGMLSMGTITPSSMAATATDCTPTISNFSDLLQAIRGGVIYANVHTVEYPNGEIRGQVVPSDELASFHEGYEMMEGGYAKIDDSDFDTVYEGYTTMFAGYTQLYDAYREVDEDDIDDSVEEMFDEAHVWMNEAIMQMHNHFIGVDDDEVNDNDDNDNNKVDEDNDVSGDNEDVDETYE